MSARKNSQDGESLYRAALGWNRFWLNAVATILIIGAFGLGFSFFFAKIQRDNRAVKAFRHGDGGVRVTNLFGPIILTHLQCHDSKGVLFVAPLPSQIIVVDSGITDISREEIEKLNWCGGGDSKTCMPSRAADIRVWYYRPELSEPPEKKE